jgi:hypothetical protein
MEHDVHVRVQLQFEDLLALSAPDRQRRTYIGGQAVLALAASPTRSSNRQRAAAGQYLLDLGACTSNPLGPVVGITLASLLLVAGCGDDSRAADWRVHPSADLTAHHGKSRSS